MRWEKNVSILVIKPKIKWIKLCHLKKSSFSLSLILFQALPPLPSTCPDGSLAFPWKYHFLCNSFQFCTISLTSVHLQGQRRKISKLLVPHCPFHILEPLQSLSELCPLSYSWVWQVILMTPFLENVLRIPAEWALGHVACFSGHSSLDKGETPDSGHTSQSPPPAGIWNCNTLWAQNAKWCEKTAWPRKHLHSYSFIHPPNTY